MTLDQTFFSHPPESIKIDSKPNQEKIFGSTDSGKEIYRSTEESSAAITRDSEEMLLIKNPAKTSMYDQDLKSDDKDDKCPFIFVIEAERDNSWAQLKNVHQNSGFDEDSDETFNRTKTEERIDCNYGSESIVNENLIKKAESKELDRLTIVDQRFS
ncbi:hypothetical protein K0M31_018105 [Melipona bicolor]|uniref:Uncharacterized protein n=1 Tax=Melipona bicolor TaxID=60889 RepID=A0AA40KE31_9HYME|nr:hypothetical protein K0M31_018105 [Melipona bicolor]